MQGAVPDAPSYCRILNYFSNLGIDTETPRFAWQVNDKDKAEYQSAFELIVSDSEDEIDVNNGSAWSTGKQSSGEQEISYAGLPLKSATRYWWKVRTWDKNDQPSPWSKKEFFLTGFINREDWNPDACWISAPQNRAGLSGAEWIWDKTDGQSDTVVLRSVLKLPENKEIITAQTSITADSCYVLTVNEIPVVKNNRWADVKDLDLARYLKTGKNLLEIQAVKPSAPKKRGGAIARSEIRFSDGKLLVWVTDTSHWTVSPGNKNRTTPAFLGKSGREPWLMAFSDKITVNDRSPMFRKSFTIDKKIKEASLFISGLGVFSGYLNGNKIGNQLIPPAWTDYDKTVNYVTYDVTSMLSRGENVIGVMLGNGWFDYQTQSLVNRHGLGESAPHIRNYGIMRMIAQLNIRYEDGTSEVIVTDPSWKTSGSPYLLTHVFGSEVYDARLEQDGWNRKGFCDHHWTNVQLIEAPAGKLEAQKVPPVTEQCAYPVIDRNSPEEGVEIFDIGQNINGQFEIKVSGPAGSTVKIVPGEIVKDGRVRPVAHKFMTYSTYTLRGNGIETWRLNFSTAGFRYLEISGVANRKQDKNKPFIHGVTGYFVCSGAKKTGSFRTSDERYDRIYDMVLKTLQSNLVTIHTDCPSYEKLGWLEVLTNTAPSYAYLYDMQSLWTGLTRNIRDGQRANGLVPNIIPDYTHGRGPFDDSPAWGTATFTLPWLQYSIYGDTASLTDNYTVMKKYLAYLTGCEDKRGLLVHGLGDWMATAGNQRDNVESAVYAWNIRLMRDISCRLGYKPDYKFYSEEFHRVCNAYQKAFWNREENCYIPEVQVNQALPLAFGLVPAEKSKTLLGSLLKIIGHPVAMSGKMGEFGPTLPFHNTIGDVGATYLWRVLGDYGQSSLVEKMMLQPDAPSYYNFVLSGMTTIPEHWLVEKSRSMNHDMYAGIMEWFYRSVGGIKNEEPGYKSFSLKPAFELSPEWVECSYDSPRGKIVSDWKRRKNVILWKIRIPVNSSATVYVPAAKKERIIVNGKNIDRIREIRLLDDKNEGYRVYKLGSGCYDFSFRLSK